MRCLARAVVAILSAAASLAQAEPPSEPPLRVRGRVTDVAGMPLRDACVGVGGGLTIADVLGKPDARCGEDGSFEVAVRAPHFAERRDVELWIAAPGKVGARAANLGWRAQAAGSQPLELGELRLPAGTTLTGRVRGADGKPLVGARVVALDCLVTTQWDLCPASAALSGADGVFRLPGVFAQAMAIRIRAEGHHDALLPCTDVGQPVDVQLTASGFVEGVVLGADGKPADALVTLQYEFLDVPQTMVPAPGGRFRLGIAAPCRFFVRAWLRDSAREARSELLEGPAAGLTLRTGGGFRIRAVDGATGAPIAPIRAAAWWHPHAPDGLEELLAWQLVPSGADGVLQQRPHPGPTGTVLVAAAGRAPLLTNPVVAKDGGEFVAKLAPEARLGGHVVDAATGAPIAGVRVTCERVTKRGRFGPRVPSRVVVTGADGAFSFGELAGREYLVRAARANGGASAETQEEIGNGEVRADLRLALPAGTDVAGTVTGAPLPPGCSVLLATAAQLAAEGEQWYGVGATNDTVRPAGAVPIVGGAFRVPHRAAGRHDAFLVVPCAPRQGPALRVPLPRVSVGAAEEPLTVDVRTRVPGAVAGKLVLAGADLPRSRFAVVTVAGSERDDVDYSERLRARRWSLVAPDGTFAVPALPGKSGLEVVDVATGVVFWRAPESVDVPAGGTVARELRIDVVAIAVRLDTGGRARVGAERLTLAADGVDPHGEPTLFGGGVHGTRGVDLTGCGNELVVHVPPGRWTIAAAVGAVPDASGNFSWGSAQPTASANVDAVAGQPASVTLELPEPAPMPEASPPPKGR
jgi:hypothetical protein